MKHWPPQDQVFWYLQKNGVTTLENSLETEVLVIGGGMAGLSAAQAFAQHGKKVVLLEQYYCGAGASGKSSGFITPNSELSLTDLTQKYGLENAQKLWDFITGGVTFIHHNIQQYNLSCGFTMQDSLMMANTKSWVKTLIQECNNLEKFGYQSQFISQADISNFLATKKYFGAMRYVGSFGVDAYAYCQAMKQQLIANGVAIFEETPVTSMQKNLATTNKAQIKADYIIVCADRFIPQLHKLTDVIYHVQTFLMASQHLTEEPIKQLFPEALFMVWDTDLIYHYFRLTDQKRLLLGGSSLLATYSGQEKHNYHRITKKINRLFANTISNVINTI